MSSLQKLSGKHEFCGRQLSYSCTLPKGINEFLLTRSIFFTDMDEILCMSTPYNYVEHLRVM